mmetsp:Transcript_4017/g.6235  ORF Transcript_4017/g.6235 Transcript_4017/m.6235 type:complete len:104 (-) Transcript_4017:192-503(-)
MISKALNFLGLILLAHAAYSAHHYKGIVAALGMTGDVSMPPADVIIETAVAFALVVIGQIAPMKMIPVRISSEKISKSWEETMQRPEFATFNHRGRALFKRNN